jgi:carbonic anhydrase
MNQFISNLKSDLPAGLVVFLVALPLCLGIALASGAPLLSGIISGIIGGVVVGFLSESHISVSGPAAGLTAVVLSAITQLQAFDIFLMAVMIAGFMQIIAGIAKSGFIADYIPSNVIKGLLAAIGIILILKQIPHAVGFDRDTEGDFSFFQRDGENTFSELLNIFNYFSWGAIIIASFSIALLIFWDKTPLAKVKFLPASLFVVILSVMANELFKIYLPQFYIGTSHLVKIPPFEDVSSLITLPDFSSIVNPKVWIVAFTIAAIASLETLLNLEAIQDIDPHKRSASPNRELIAQGVGNTFAGLLGGLPMTSVIVRSSVNIHAGAKSKASSILHGFMLIASVLFLAPLINLIPLSALAAILIITGYKLAKTELFIDMYQKGWNQFIPFMVTVLAIVFTDLLIGILIGSMVSIFYLLKNNFKSPFTIQKEQINVGETIRIEFPNQVTFLNKASIKNTLFSLPNGSKVILDASGTDFIDHDVLEIIENFKNTVSVENNIQLNIIGLKDKYNLNDHIQFINVLDKETQQRLTPQEILDLLKQGNERFVKGKWAEKYFHHQINATSFGQNPIATIVSCIDSRTSPEIIFDMGLGDVISIRIAGNIISEEIIGSIELACSKIGTKLVVVLGHSNCGAVASAVNQITEGHIGSVTHKIEKAIQQCNCDRESILKDHHILDRVIKLNVNNSIEEILTHSPYIAQQIKTPDLNIVPAFYDTATGIVTFGKEV